MLLLTGGVAGEGRVETDRASPGPLCQAVFLPPAASPERQVRREQHRGWCSLGFVRSIAVTSRMCAALSSPRWIALLLTVVEGHAPFTAAALQRQVTVPQVGGRDCGAHGQAPAEAQAGSRHECREQGLARSGPLASDG